MHYIKSKFRAQAFRRASIVFVLAYLSLFVAGGMVIYTFIDRSGEKLLILGIVLGVTLLLWATTMIVSGTCRCQLCQASTMRSLKCSHHKNAKKLLGSYRFRIAVAVLCKGAYRCSYCGEAFSLRPKVENLELPQVPPRRMAPSRRTTQIPAKRRP